jgi:hypothetical protein
MAMETDENSAGFKSGAIFGGVTLAVGALLPGHLLFGNWLAELQRAAWPPVSDEPVIEWALVRGGCQPPEAR